MKQKKEDSIRIRLNYDLKEKYQKYCDDNGYSLSKRIRMFLEKDLNNKIDIKNND